MSEVLLLKFKIKPEKKKIWLDWCNESKRRKEEVLATLRLEGMYTESCFLSQDGNYVYHFMEAKDLKQAQEIYKKSESEIDIKYKEKQQLSLEYVETLTELFHFETISN